MDIEDSGRAGIEVVVEVDSGTDEVLVVIEVDIIDVIDVVGVTTVVVSEVRPPVVGVSVDITSVVVSAPASTVIAKSFAALIEGPAGRQFSMPGY